MDQMGRTEREAEATVRLEACGLSRSLLLLFVSPARQPMGASARAASKAKAQSSPWRPGPAAARRPGPGRSRSSLRSSAVLCRAPSRIAERTGIFGHGAKRFHLI